MCSFVKVKLGKERPFEETSEPGRQVLLSHSLFSSLEACQGKDQGCWQYGTCRASVFLCDGQGSLCVHPWAGGGIQILGCGLQHCSPETDTREGHVMVSMAPVLAQLGLCPILSHCPPWLLRWFCSEGAREKCLGVQVEAGSEHP
jgi:hypothetical protein